MITRCLVRPRSHVAVQPALRLPPITPDYVRTVPQTGRVTAILDTSVAVRGDNGFVRQYAATPETIAVSADRAETLALQR
jgi:hypothetical protein